MPGLALPASAPPLVGTAEPIGTPWPDRLLRGLRWVALGAAFVLNLFTEGPSGFSHEPEWVILGLAGYFAALDLAAGRWRRLADHPLPLLALDTLAVSLAVLLAGGWHSSVFVVYIPLVLGAAVQLGLAEALAWTAGLSAIYAALCLSLPNWTGRAAEIESLAARLASLLAVGLVGTTFSRELRAIQQRRQVEAHLLERLTLLNELMSLEMSANLDQRAVAAAAARVARRALRADLAALEVDGLPGPDGDGWLADPAADAATRAALSSLGQLARATDRPLLLADERAGWGAVICAPLRLPDGGLGLLYAAGHQPGGLGPAQLDLAGAIAHEAALALGNARLYAREQATASRLRELEQQKSEFLSTVSHEFRTPLTAIGSAVGLLLASGENLTDDQQALARNVQRNTTRLGGLVADLLEMARLRDGRVRLSRQSLDPAAVAREAVAALQPLLDGKQQRVVLEVEPDLPPLRADRRKLEHALLNLLSNAHRHGPAGGEIRLRLARSGPVAIRFAVADRGPGVPPAERQAIFDPFYARAEGAPGGTGLGLAIARWLATLHGGRLWLEETAEPGACFVLEVPLDQETTDDDDEDPDR